MNARSTRRAATGSTREHSLETTIKRLVGLVAAMAIVLPVSAQAATGQATPPQSAIDNASATWAMKGLVLLAGGIAVAVRTGAVRTRPA